MKGTVKHTKSGRCASQDRRPQSQQLAVDQGGCSGQLLSQGPEVGDDQIAAVFPRHEALIDRDADDPDQVDQEAGGQKLGPIRQGQITVGLLQQIGLHPETGKARLGAEGSRADAVDQAGVLNPE